jgi:hypothetical protein
MPRPRKAKNTLDIRRLALIGGQARLAEINAESQKILSVFPELRRSVNGTGATGPSAQSPGPLRRRTKMSAEARKRIAEAQKKRWAEWRKQNRA